MSEPPSDRDRDLEAIRDAYDRYSREGRGRIWDLRNRGFARIIEDRDRALIAALAESLPSAGGRVLDLGAGDGRLAVVAQEAGLPVNGWVGVDLDPAAVERAARSYPFAIFVRASADDLPFDAGSFRAVVASTLFSSFPSSALELSVAAEIARVLVPGGWLVWYDLRYDNPGNPAVHGIGRAELARHFPGWKTELRSMTLIPPISRRLGPATRVLYPLLHAIPPLRSHLVGRLQRPDHVAHE